MTPGAVFNFHVDNIHPESNREGWDCGGDRERGVFRHLLDLRKRFPQVKVTLFVTADWTDRSQPLWARALGRAVPEWRRNPRHWPPSTFRLDRHREWCRWLASLEGFELAFHGLHHYNPRGFHGQEFIGLGYDECVSRLRRSEEIFRQTGLPASRGFRSPGWEVTEPLLRALADLNYDYVAGSGDFETPPSRTAVSEGAGLRGPPLIFPAYHRGVLNLPQNWDIRKSSVERGLAIVREGGLLSAKGHINPVYENERYDNGLSEETMNHLCEMLEALEGEEVRYMALSEVARGFRAGELWPEAPR